MISLCSRLTAQSHLVLVYTFSFYLICQEQRGSGHEKKIMPLIEQKRWLPLKAIAYKKDNSLDFQCMNHQMLDCLQSKPIVSMRVDMVIHLRRCKHKLIFTNRTGVAQWCYNPSKNIILDHQSSQSQQRGAVHK